MTHGRIRLDPGYIPGPFKHPNASRKIGVLDVSPSATRKIGFLIFVFQLVINPPFSSLLAATSLEQIGPVFHEEYGHAIQIRP